MIHIGKHSFDIQPIDAVDFLNTNWLDENPTYVLANKNHARDHRGFFYSFTGNEEKFELDCKGLKHPIDVIFYNSVGEILATYRQYIPKDEMPYCHNARGAYVLASGTIEKCDIKIGDIIKFDGPLMYEDETDKIETADRYYKFQNEVFAEKWNEKYDYNERFYYSYFKHRWCINGGPQFKYELYKFEQILEIKKEELTKEQALKIIQDTEQRLRTDFQKYHEKYYKSDTYLLFSYNEKEDTAKIYDFIQGWIDSDHVPNIEEFATVHLTREEIDQEIERMSSCDDEMKKYMNLINLYDSGNKDQFYKIGYYAQDQKSKKIFKIVDDMNLVIEISGLWSHQWKKIDKKHIANLDLKRISLDELERFFKERNPFYASVAGK